MKKRRFHEPSRRIWNYYHPEFTRRAAVPVYLQSPTRCLSASNEFFAGCASFKRVDGHWVCAIADDCLAFLLKLDPIAAKMELLKRGFSWQWEPRSAGPGKIPAARTPTLPGNIPGETPCNKLEDPNQSNLVTKPSGIAPAARDTALSRGSQCCSVERAESALNPDRSQANYAWRCFVQPLTQPSVIALGSIDSQRLNHKDTQFPGHTIPDAQQRVSNAAASPRAVNRF